MGPNGISWDLGRSVRVNPPDLRRNEKEFSMDQAQKEPGTRAHGVPCKFAVNSLSDCGSSSVYAGLGLGRKFRCYFR